jgi:hypothetical protein
MSGYHNYSKSNNAVSAEQDGRFPATHAAKLLKLPPGFVRERCTFASNGEKHHVSKYYNFVDFYDTEAIRRWINNDEDAIEEAGGSFEAALAAWKERQAATRASGAVEHIDVTVTWLEWGGTRNFPTVKERNADHCTVIDGGGKFLTIILPDGASFKKGRDTRGFEVSKNGKRMGL